MKAMLAAAAVLAAATAAHAEVADLQPNGFEVKQAVQVAVPPDKAYAAMADIGKWWNHSWSGDPSNLSIDVARGCWCESLPDGGMVRHMTLTFVEPGKSVRMFGGLGPLQFTGLAGHLSWTVKAKDGGSEIAWTYDVGGYARGGVESWSTAVDGVLGEQLGRLKAYAETGKSD